MQNSTYSIGDPIKARCTKCRKNTAHTILSLVDKAPAMVECGACKRQHLYRQPTAEKKPAVRQAAHRKDAERQEWEDLRQDMNSAKAKAYSMSATYKVRAVINHPVFGLGIVQRVVGPQKVEILFEEGKKMMRCRQ